MFSSHRTGWQRIPIQDSNSKEDARVGTAKGMSDPADGRAADVVGVSQGCEAGNTGDYVPAGDACRPVNPTESPESIGVAVSVGPSQSDETLQALRRRIERLEQENARLKDALDQAAGEADEQGEQVAASIKSLQNDMYWASNQIGRTFREQVDESLKLLQSSIEELRGERDALGNDLVDWQGRLLKTRSGTIASCYRDLVLNAAYLKGQCDRLSRRSPYASAVSGDSLPKEVLGILEDETNTLNVMASKMERAFAEMGYVVFRPEVGEVYDSRRELAKNNQGSLGFARKELRIVSCVCPGVETYDEDPLSRNVIVQAVVEVEPARDAQQSADAF